MPLFISSNKGMNVGRKECRAAPWAGLWSGIGGGQREPAAGEVTAPLIPAGLAVSSQPQLPQQPILLPAVLEPDE